MLSTDKSKGFRGNSKYRQLHVIKRINDNLDGLTDRFILADSSVQINMMDQWLSFGQISLGRMIFLDEETDVLQKNKRYLYSDLEMALVYFIQIKQLYPRIKDKEGFDFLTAERNMLRFSRFLEELKLNLYVHAMYI
jgi:hypothetical protein